MAAHPEVPPESPYAFLTAEQTRTWYAWMKLQLRLRYEMNRQLRADSDISLADYDVLVALTSEPDGAMTMSALATRIGWERSRASHHAKRLADRGLLDLRRWEHDRRSTAVALTDDGWRTLREATPRHTELVKQMFFGDLTADELPGFAAVLERVYESVIEHGTLPRPADHP
ncbi:MULTISPECIES: MarR family winged helix-turn-helix transcriptional regulator [unclassified Curtobacterium]|uniref:MarR family winged helix-turn-helix transcriptional regulator n=1 Tax=unclassified Curtobacterium TaxID=257496 RepID=UPI000DA7BCF2|nr:MULTISPECIES: MarR family transcriptional regulator [unclassified Curtobacterium]PZE68869.1 MarR family transcriptional regulator [Curtobacterium sp. MCBD17_021]WIB27723.1 MarR family transcriptional regulator [Curtobacterium sp. MCSS17_015]